MIAKKTYAGIDLGSNSCKMLICDETGKQLCLRTWQTRLAEGMVEHNKITEEAINRGRQCFFEARQLLDTYNVVPENRRAVATAACRDSVNGAEFVQKIYEESGIRLEIIDGAEEAMLNLKGALEHVLGRTRFVIVFDLGGGSTEITLATNKKTPEILETISIPLGARTASEKFDLIEYDEARAENLRAEVNRFMDSFLEKADLANRQDLCVVATSSTPLRLVSMIYQFEKYDREKADGKHMTKEQMDGAIDSVLYSKREELAANPYIGDKRSYIFIAACIIFKIIYERLNVLEVTASLKSAKDGIVSSLMERDGYAKADTISKRS